MHLVPAAASSSDARAFGALVGWINGAPATAVPRIRHGAARWWMALRLSTLPPPMIVRSVGGAVMLAAVLTLPAFAQVPAPAAPRVGTVAAELRPVTPAKEFVGRIEAVERVEVRARVTGYLKPCCSRRATASRRARSCSESSRRRSRRRCSRRRARCCRRRAR